jgi:hypothetical protein
VSWDIDVTSTYRSDLVGLAADVDEAVANTLLEWLTRGPPRRNPRNLAGMVFYEEDIGDKHQAAYMIDDVRQRFSDALDS